MEHFWRTTALKHDLSLRLDGDGSGESAYKYNSLLVLDAKKVDNPPLYVFPRHKAAEWIVQMKGLFLTVVSLSNDILSDQGSEVLDGVKAIDSRKKEGEAKKCLDNDNRRIYNVELEIHGGPVHCCIVNFTECIFVLTSDSCSDMTTCVRYLHDVVPHFLPHSHNSLLNSSSETSRVVDSYVAPALEMVGTIEWVNIPFRHRGHVLSSELEDALLDIEVKLDLCEGGVGVTCGGVVVVSNSDIVYTSLPANFEQIVLQTLYFRELLSITQGYVIWFNKLYQHSFKVKKQNWYVIAVCKAGMSVAQLLGIFGEPDKDLVIRAARDLENLLDIHGSEIKQHLPCQAIPLKHCQVFGYKYGEKRGFHCETRYESIVEYHHAQEDSGATNRARFVLQLEGDLHVGQRIIAHKVFTVVYSSKGVHDIETMFCELGI